MKLRYLIPAALLLLPGCGANHNTDRDIYHVSILNSFASFTDRYIDKRNAKVYDDNYSRLGKPDGKLNAVHVSAESLNQKIIIDYEYEERDTTIEWDSIHTITIPCNSSDAKELQKDFEKVKSDFKEQEIQRLLSESKK
ncbi:MAG: hypothetical protein V1802_03500 [Candidatus Aenigmatarchaeota archaeon]